MTWLKFLVFFAAASGVVIGYALTTTEQLGLCVPGKTNCIFGGYEFTVGQPLLNISIAFFVSSLLFFFLSNKSFYRWIGFSILYLALSGYLVYISPVDHHSPLLLDPIKLDVSKFLAVLLFILSLIYAAIRFFREKKQKQ